VRPSQLVWIVGACVGCGRVGFGASGDAAVAPPDATVPVDAGVPSVPDDAMVCGTPEQRVHADEGTAHSDGGVPTTWVSNPPTSGIHFDAWVRWNRSYAGQVIPRGNWVHNLEHGGTVFGYHCEVPCPGEVARMTAMLDMLPLDTVCPALMHRAILVEDPDLPPGVRFSAAAWLNSWTSNCVDEASLTAFYIAHLDRGPEANCGLGSFPP
jgi:Protein of unknown function (DUF3105)